MNIPRPIDADLVTLLHEITDDPAQLLTGFTQRLRSTKHKLPQSLALDEDGFFNQAERHMLRRHREEIGDLLYEKCLLYMQDKRTEGGLVDWEYKGIGRASVEARQASVEAKLPSDAIEDIGSAVVVSLSDISLIPVCELALRLRPAFRAQSILVMALEQSGEYDRALSLLSSFANHSSTRKEAGVLLANQSYVLCSKGENRSALIYSRDSYCVDDSRSSQIYSLVAMELCYGDKASIRASSRLLEDYSGSSDDSYGPSGLYSLVAELRKMSSGYRDQMDVSQIDLLMSIGDGLPPKARKLANAIAEEE